MINRNSFTSLKTLFLQLECIDMSQYAIHKNIVYPVGWGCRILNLQTPNPGQDMTQDQFLSEV